MNMPTTNIEARRVITEASKLILDSYMPKYAEVNGNDPDKMEHNKNSLYYAIRKILIAYRVSDTHEYSAATQLLFPITIPFDVYTKAMELITDRSLETAIDMALKSRLD